MVSTYDPILAITDGTLAGYIDLMDPQLGWWIRDWNPTIADYKGGGEWVDSETSEGRKPVDKRFGNTIENFTFGLNGRNQDSLIYALQNLLALGENAYDYWYTPLAAGLTNPIYLIAKSGHETNTRYAEIYRIRIPGVKNPYEVPFALQSKIRALEDLTLQIERGHWHENPPGTGTCVQINSQQAWDYTRKWSILSTAIIDNGLIITSEDVMLGGNDGDILRSTNLGTSFTTVYTGTSGYGIETFVELSTGTILAMTGAGQTNGKILRSIDGGQTWTSVATLNFGGLSNTGDFGVSPSGNVLVSAASPNIVYLSADDGQSFIKVSDISDGGGVIGTFVTLSSGRILFSASGERVIFSDNEGYTWQILVDYGTGGDSYLMTIDTDDTIFSTRFSGNSNLYRSKDGGNSLQLLGETLGLDNATRKPFIASNGDIYFPATSHFYVSRDKGFTVIQETGPASGSGYEFAEDSAGAIYNMMNAKLYKKPAPANTAMGIGNTCANSVYISNQMKVSNITHVKQDDGGVITDLFPAASFPINLLPTTPAVNDALYVGTDTSVFDTGPFNNVIFDLNKVGGSITIVIEYYNGGWTTLATTDNTNGLKTYGISSVYFIPPTDWATTTVDSITGYWIRFRVTALGATPSVVTQDNRDVYSSVFPYIQFASTQTKGDIPSIARIKLENKSDNSGRDSSLEAYSNRIIMGLSNDNTSGNFVAHLNVSDEQNPPGINISLGSNTSFETNVKSPTGRRAVYNPGTVDSLADRVTFSLGPTIAPDFYGNFHAYMRGRRFGGTSSEVNVVLKIIAGSGSPIFTSESQQFQTTLDWELIDFGRVRISPVGIINRNDKADQIQLIIQADSTSGVYAPDVAFYDLILIPTNHYFGDFIDNNNNGDSIIGYDDSLFKYLDVDSIVDPRAPGTRALVKTVYNEITSIYTPISPKFILLPKVAQKLWILSARTSATGTDYAWLSEPWVSHSIQLYKNDRFLVFRGAN